MRCDHDLLCVCRRRAGMVDLRGWFGRTARSRARVDRCRPSSWALSASAAATGWMPALSELWFIWPTTDQVRASAH